MIEPPTINFPLGIFFRCLRERGLMKILLCPGPNARWREWLIPRAPFSAAQRPRALRQHKISKQALGIRDWWMKHCFNEDIQWGMVWWPRFKSLLFLLQYEITRIVFWPALFSYRLRVSVFYHRTHQSVHKPPAPSSLAPPPHTSAPVAAPTRGIPDVTPQGTVPLTAAHVSVGSVWQPLRIPTRPLPASLHVEYHSFGSGLIWN